MTQLLNPQVLKGNWTKGFALDIHTISSTPLGDGHFDNQYSKMGEFIKNIKNHDKEGLIQELGEIISNFIRGKNKELTSNEYPYPTLNGIICVPPSKTNRSFQPVLELGKEIYKNMHIPILTNLKKNKKTPTMKTLSIEESKNELNGAFSIDNPEELNGKNILLFDDLYGTGTTLTEITKTIKENTYVKNVFVLTVTKTRTSHGIRNDSNTDTTNDLPF